MPTNVEGNRRADETRTEDQTVCRRVRLTVRLGGARLLVKLGEEPARLLGLDKNYQCLW